MFALFALALTSLLARNLWLGAGGLALVGALDAVASRRGETPGYFRWFRPVQMGVCAVATAVVAGATS
jgi:hypothetical protein